MDENKFIPIVTINNKKDERVVEIDGVEKKVELPAEEGFNIESKDLEGVFEKHFFLKELEAVILFDRYQIQSKYQVDPTYNSNEFEFSGNRNNLRVYSSSEGKVLYRGDYAGAKEFFATGKETSFGTIEKTFDVFLILYILVGEEVLRFKWKMNQNNNWFDYKDGCEDNRGDKGYRGIKTKFSLEKKKFGTNEFWSCTLQNVGKVDRKKADKIGDALELKQDEDAASYNHPVDPSPIKEKDAVDIDEIPF